jgi:hypothetical protein
MSVFRVVTLRGSPICINVLEERSCLLLQAEVLKMDALCSSETLVLVTQCTFTRLYNPEDQTRRHHRRENRKSQICITHQARMSFCSCTYCISFNGFELGGLGCFKTPDLIRKAASWNMCHRGQAPGTPTECQSGCNNPEVASDIPVPSSDVTLNKPHSCLLLERYILPG